MKTFLSNFKDNFRYVSTNNPETYKKKIFKSLALIALVFSLFRLCIHSIFSYTQNSVSDIMINALPFLIIVLAIGIMKYYYVASKFVGMVLLPLAGTIVSLQYHDNSVQYLLLLFLIVSFIIFDKLHEIVICFVWNSILYTTMQLHIIGAFTNEMSLGEMITGISDGAIFLGITFVLLTYLKNTVNFYVKRIANDNDALIEINSDLIGMHKELIEKNKVLEKDQFNMNSSHKVLSKILSVISHDIKSPLISVKNIINYTKDLKSNKENIVHYIPEISKTLNNTVGLLENLLEWSRNQSNQEETKQEFINFNVIVQEVMDLYSLPLKTKQIRIEIENPTNAFVTFNKPMMMTILRNLLSNAVKFTKIGGQIKIVATPIQGKVKIQIINEVEEIAQETIDKLNSDSDVLQIGTAGEVGSGFGLLITKDFLNANNAKLIFSQRNNKLVLSEFNIKGYINSKLKAITSNELSNYRLSVK